MSNEMYGYLLERYCAGTLNDKGLNTAVAKGWITAAEAESIRAERDRRQAQGDEALIRELEADSSAQATASTPEVSS